MESLAPFTVFIAIVCAYVLGGWLATTNYINPVYTTMTWELLGLGETKDSEGKSVSWHVIESMAVALGMTSLLLLIIFLIITTGSFIFVLLFLIGWTMVFILFGLVLNPHLRARQIIFAAIGAAVLVLGTVVFPQSWVFEFLIACCAATVTGVMYCRIPIRLLGTLSAGLVIYDVAHVYFTGFMQQGARLLNDSTPLPNVTMIRVPETFSLTAGAFMHVGLGDIIFPGLWVSVAVLLYREGKNSLWLPVASVSGMYCGWIGAYQIMHLTNKPVPALMVLLPVCASTFFLMGRFTRLPTSESLST